MSVEQIIAIVEERKLTLILKDGQPFVKGDPEQVTPPLKDALKRYRKALIEHLERANAEQPI